MSGLFGSIKEKVISYVEVNVNLFKIKLIGRTSNVMSYFMFALVVLILLCCILLFFGYALTEVFFEAGLSRGGAYLLTGVIYCVFLGVVLLVRGNLTRFFNNTFISILTETDDQDEDEKQDENDN